MTRGDDSGFTLVEVLVAMLIMAVMAVMAWQGVDGIVRNRDGSQERLGLTLRLNTVIAQWEQDLTSVQDSAAVPVSLTCDGATVRLARHTPNGMQIVAWSLRPDGDSSAWWRWTGPEVIAAGGLTDSWMRSLQLQGNEPGQVRTLSGLTRWQVYFYQGNAWTNCQSTRDTVAQVAGQATSAPPRTALPSGVRLVLTFGPGSGEQGTLTRDTLLPPGL